MALPLLALPRVPLNITNDHVGGHQTASNTSTSPTPRQNIADSISTNETILCVGILIATVQLSLAAIAYRFVKSGEKLQEATICAPKASDSVADEIETITPGPEEDTEEREKKSIAGLLSTPLLALILPVIPPVQKLLDSMSAPALILIIIVLSLTPLILTFVKETRSSSSVAQEPCQVQKRNERRRLTSIALACMLAVEAEEEFEDSKCWSGDSWLGRSTVSEFCGWGEEVVEWSGERRREVERWIEGVDDEGWGRGRVNGFCEHGFEGSCTWWL